MKCRVWYEVCFILRIYMTDITAQKIKFSIKDFFGKCDQILSFLTCTYMTSLISIAMFRFIFDLLSILMVMINIKKIELINATVRRLSNLVSVKYIFLPTKLWLIHSIFVWSKPSFYVKYFKKSCSSIFSSNKIFNFVEYVRIESCFIMKTS